MKTDTPAIAQSLVLCHFSTTAPATNALNRSATARAIASAGAAKNAARVYNTVLTARGTAIGRAVSLQQRTGVKIRRLGLPCPSGGIYLRVKDIAKAQDIFDDAMLELEAVREEILRSYPAQMKDLEGRLGSFMHEVTIPTATEVASKFTMSLSIVNQPVAVTDSVLVGLSAEVANRVRAESEQQIDKMLRQAHAAPVEDLKAVLTEFIDKMRHAERLHMTQFDKLRDEAKRVEELDILGLEELNEVIRMAAEAAVEPSGVMDQHQRIAVAEKAERASAKADETLAALGL